MIRVDLDLENPDDLQQASAQWRFAQGLVPASPMKDWWPKLKAALRGSPIMMIRDGKFASPSRKAGPGESPSAGIVLLSQCPSRVHGMDVKGLPMHFETCIDDYGEIWINDECNRQTGAVAGFNIPQRVLITRDTQPGTKYVIACLAVNGPLAAPGAESLCAMPGWPLRTMPRPGPLSLEDSRPLGLALLIAQAPVHLFQKLLHLRRKGWRALLTGFPWLRHRSLSQAAGSGFWPGDYEPRRHLFAGTAVDHARYLSSRTANCTCHTGFPVVCQHRSNPHQAGHSGATD